MKKTLIYVGVLAIALVFWFLRAKIDAVAIQTREAQIASLRDAVQTRDEMLAQSRALTASHEDTLQLLKDKLKDLAQDEAQIATLKRAQEADQTIIASLKNDNDADIRALKEQIQTKDDQIAQLNEKLVQTIAYYQAQLNSAHDAIASEHAPAPPPDDEKKIYPKDDGFDAQSLGTGLFAYQVFSQLNNPTNAPQPPPIPNTSPWTFGGTGNSGISANEAFYVSNAKNGDHDGKTSQAGQAAFLQFKGSWFSQKIRLPAGTYSVGFDFEARRDYGEADGIAVSLNGKDVYAGAPTDTNNFSHVTTEIVTLPADGEYELKFRGLGALNDPGGDHTTFIDNICINVVDSHKHPLKKVAAGNSGVINEIGK